MKRDEGVQRKEEMKQRGERRCEKREKEKRRWRVRK